MLDADPMYLRKRLSAQLRAARKEAGYSQPEVAEEMVWSLSKVMRLESGRTKISVTDLRALIDFYGVSEEAGAELLASARRPGVSPGGRNIDSSSRRASSPTSVTSVRVDRAQLRDLVHPRAAADRGVRPRRPRPFRRAGEGRPPRTADAASGADAAAFQGDGAPLPDRRSGPEARSRLPGRHARAAGTPRGVEPASACTHRCRAVRRRAVSAAALTLRDLRVSQHGAGPVVYLENPDGSVILRDKATVGVQRSIEDYLEAFWEVENTCAKPITEWEVTPVAT